jgi:hypothetical protein
MPDCSGKAMVQGLLAVAEQLRVANLIALDRAYELECVTHGTDQIAVREYDPTVRKALGLKEES